MSQNNINNSGKMVSLLGAHLNKLVTVYTEAGTSFTGVLVSVNPEITENHILLSTYNTSCLHLDGSKILAFNCNDYKPIPEDKQLISEFYQAQRNSK